jgi:arsenic resistance protein ArsH
MTGVMKNTLDWLEMTSKFSNPYLTGKVVALVSWGDGSQAMQGINAMDAVAKALRAWVLPFSVPIMKEHLYDPESKDFTASYKNKFDRMIALLGDARIGEKQMSNLNENS